MKEEKAKAWSTIFLFSFIMGFVGGGKKKTKKKRERKNKEERFCLPLHDAHVTNDKKGERGPPGRTIAGTSAFCQSLRGKKKKKGEKERGDTRLE